MDDNTADAISPVGTGGLGTRPPAVPTLYGFHRESGEWVCLAHFEGEATGEESLRKCLSKDQPDTKQVVIVWDDFSAFKLDYMVQVRWYK